MTSTAKPAENFNFRYLPVTVATCFRDALGCYRNGLLPAYATMCRMTAQAVFDDLGEAAKLKIYDQVEEIAQLANIDDRMYRNIRNILFDADCSSLFQPDGIDRETAAIMLEMMKDILHQAYIRRALLRQKLRMRQFFANPSDEAEQAAEPHSDDPKISPLKRRIS